MEVKDWPTWISAGASIISSLGVFLTYWQVCIIRAQAVTQFEDELDREYRQIISKLPYQAILKMELTPQEYTDHKKQLFIYIDLCNQQVFYRKYKRIGKSAWQSWLDGIKSNLESPSFNQAWIEVKSNIPHYEELRRLEKEGFRSDPANWT